MGAVLEGARTVFGLLQVGVYSLYRITFRAADPPPPPMYDVLMLGFAGAGKSSIMKLLLGEPLTDIEPTQGAIQT